jgi:hypothetical protein
VFRYRHENAALSRRLAERARRSNHGSLADKFEAKSRQAEAQAQAIRDLLLGAKIQAEAENETE